MRLKTTREAECNHIRKNKEYMDSLYEQIKPKLPVGLTRQAWEDNLEFIPQWDKDEIEYISSMKMKYGRLSEIEKKDLIEARVYQAKAFLQLFQKTAEQYISPEWKEYILDEYQNERGKNGAKEFLQACGLIMQANGFIEDDFALTCEADISCSYKETMQVFPELLEIYRKMLEEIFMDGKEDSHNQKREETPVLQQPDYILEMIKQGRLYPDGKRAMKSLDDVLDFLFQVLDTVPAKFIHETFQKPDGKPYSMKHIQGVLEKYNYGKTPGKPRKTSRQSK